MLVSLGEAGPSSLEVWPPGWAALVCVPRLTERRDDILPAIQSRFDESPAPLRPRLDERARQALREHSWPEDRDELLRVAEWLRVAYAGTRVRLLDLPIAVFAEEYANRVLTGRGELTLDELMQEIEGEVIANAVERAGSVHKAADALRASYRTLRAKLARWRRGHRRGRE